VGRQIHRTDNLGTNILADHKCQGTELLRAEVEGPSRGRGVTRGIRVGLSRGGARCARQQRLQLSSEGK